MKTRTWFSRMAPLYATILLFLMVSFVRADEHISAELLPEPGEFTVGDVVTLRLEVNHPAGYRMLPLRPGQIWSDSDLVHFEVRSVSTVEVTKNDDGSETSVQNIEVTFWATGTFTAPPLAISISDTAGDLQEIEVEPVSLTVNSVLVDGDDELRDIKPQASLPLFNELVRRWPWILAGLLLIIVVGWILRRRKQRRRDDTPIEIPDLRPAYQVALDELARIEGLNLPAEGRLKEHYTLVADVVRQYLEAGHQVPAMDRTTVEIRRTLKQLTFPATQRSEVVDLLADADLVKFAKVIPELSQAQQFPEQARQFVLVTRREPEEISQNGESSQLVEMAG